MRNEVDPTEQIDFAATPPMGTTIALLSLLHFFCCGGLLLLLSGVGLTAILPSWPVIGGGVALLGFAGFVRYFRNGCANDDRGKAGRSEP